jgi:hypothetical protein
MTRRRYTEDQLTPVRRQLTGTYRRQGDPGRGARRECWEAHSLDGIWSYHRLEEPGTPWVIRHEPTGYATVFELATTLDDARHDTAGPGAWRLLWRDACWLLGNYPEAPARPGRSSPHDDARALLTWLADAGLTPPLASANTEAT